MISAKRSAQRVRWAGSASRSRTRSSRSSKSTAGARRLGRRVRRAERVEQRVEQGERGVRVVRRARLAVRGPDLAVGAAGGILERLRAAAELRRVERAGQRRLAAGGRDPLGGLERRARLADADAGTGGRERGGGRRGGRGQRRGVGRRLGRRHGQPRMGRPAAAERGVRAGDHRLQLAAVGRREVDGRAAPARDPRLQRRLERLRGEPPLRRPRRARRSAGRAPRPAGGCAGPGRRSRGSSRSRRRRPRARAPSRPARRSGAGSARAARRPPSR